jgi:hypothetical protein
MVGSMITVLMTTKPILTATGPTVIAILVATVSGITIVLMAP